MLEESVAQQQLVCVCEEEEDQAHAAYTRLSSLRVHFGVASAR